jgi:hypothetical protein
MATEKPIPELDQSPADTALEMARLRARIADLEAAKTAAPSFTITSNTEVSAGLDELDHEWWFYKIDLPPSGGIEIKLNGIAYYHGEQYKVDTDTLRTLKDIVFRCWKHEGDIHGSNENFYRRPQERVLRGTR